MGKKRRNYPNLEELLDRAWCYYCERDFEDLKLLISHQKAKHFKCERCGRRLNTAGGLSVHMNQVHKETLSQVENALEGREGLDVEIFGMEGIPEAALQQHQQQITDDFHKNRADRQAATGNPPPGQGMGMGMGMGGESNGVQGAPHKKIKIETAEELKARLAAYRAQAGARKAAAEQAEAAAAAAAATQPQPQGVPPGSGAPPAYSGGLPQRPGAGGYGGGATTLDDLVSGAASGGGAPSPSADEIDRVIRMAEAGIRPGEAPAAPTTAAAPAEKEKEKPSKKDKATRMVYQDGDFSLEEKMAQMTRYAVAV
ncbi:hypothetical protein HMPREF1624_02947 [Sporothrix schenckii ATCC 58251]|uniref:C2H2-type domain-containing protein n=1 Tax=Sporothrix schenckii (strain ATCC 58251 / de Perez 2211183) TaxID=1391915 RepID=U7Q1B2_SPOS1|nr:hypothetical protein HMPREF1624_02947 [Sporothrix schenckii ATCC 58251]